MYVFTCAFEEKNPFIAIENCLCKWLFSKFVFICMSSDQEFKYNEHKMLNHVSGTIIVGVGDFDGILFSLITAHNSFYCY